MPNEENNYYGKLVDNMYLCVITLFKIATVIVVLFWERFAKTTVSWSNRQLHYRLILKLGKEMQINHHS
jgi:hypothetical protein